MLWRRAISPAAARCSTSASREGRAIDGHGDLLADDIFLLDDGPRVLDCIEFDERLRFGDTLADVAFLAMDLERLGRPDLADALPCRLPGARRRHLARIARPPSRRVPGPGPGQGAAPSEPARARRPPCTRRASCSEWRAATSRQAPCDSSWWAGCPVPGSPRWRSGSADALGGTVIRSDAVRKELAGLRPDEPAPAEFGAGIYTADVTEDTYREVLRRTEVALGLGEIVVLDASWGSDRWRTEARTLAAGTSSELVELRCTRAP